MSSNNNSFTITDEHLEWDQDDPRDTRESSQVSGAGEGVTVIKASERMRTLLIAAEGALAGGMVVAFVAAITLSPSSSGSSAAAAATPSRARHAAHAMVLAPPATQAKGKRHHTSKHNHTSKQNHTSKKDHTTKQPEVKQHHAKRPRTQSHTHTHTQSAATKHIRYQPRQHDRKPTARQGRSK